MFRNSLLVMALALGLAGCVNGKPVLFTSVANPVSATNLYEAELAWDATLKTFVELRGLCASRTLPPACRTYVIQGQKIIKNAAAADVAARNFVTANPTIDATNVVSAFTGLLSSFQSTVTNLSATK